MALFVSFANSMRIAWQVPWSSVYLCMHLQGTAWLLWNLWCVWLYLCPVVCLGSIYCHVLSLGNHWVVFRVSRYKQRSHWSSFEGVPTHVAGTACPQKSPWIIVLSEELWGVIPLYPSSTLMPETLWIVCTEWTTNSMMHASNEQFRKLVLSVVAGNSNDMWPEASFGEEDDIKGKQDSIWRTT